MQKILLRLFLKNKDENTVSREAYGAFAGAVGTACNILLCLFKIAAGSVAGSIAVVADGVNNLSDAASSIVTLAGFKMSQKPADREHPYGHARMEYMAGIFVSVAIILVGAELLQTSFQKILAPVGVDFSLLTFVVLGASILVKGWMWAFYRSMGREIASPTLSVAAGDSRNDVVTTLAVLAGALIQHFTGWMLDGWLGCAVAAFIVVTGVLSIKETMNPLLGEAPDAELVRRVYGLIMAREEVLGVHDLLVHSYGPGRQFATVHVEMDAAGETMKSHGVIDNIERQVEREIGVKLVIHYDPIAPHDHKTEALAKEINGIVQGIDPALTIHDLRLAPTHDHINVIFDVGVPPQYNGATPALKSRVTAAVAALDKRYYPVVEIDRNYLPPQEGDR